MEKNIFEDIKKIVIFNILDLWNILNSDFVILWFLISLLILLSPVLNVFSIAAIILIFIICVRNFVKELSIDPEYIYFFVNPSENTDKIPKIENIFKQSMKNLLATFFNSLLIILLVNMGWIIFSILLYLLTITMNTKIIMKTLIIILIILLCFSMVLIQIITYLLLPLILLKMVECESTKDLIYNILYIWQDLQDENTLIFFRSLIFDSFWRIVIISFFSIPFAIFFLVLYKFLIINPLFSIFMGWFIISLILGLLIVLFIIDFTKNYYVYFHYV
ncbi:MAG: hypothetical protein ABDH21_05200 [bacterium]